MTKRPVKREEALRRNSTSTSVNRAFAILDALAGGSESGIALAETASKLHLSRSTAHRYLITLEKLGAIERDGQDRFHLGLKMIELAGRTLSSNDLRQQGEPFLRELASRTEETSHLAVLSGLEVVYIAKADSARAIRMYSHIGARAPVYSTALGKAILAHSDKTLFEQVVQAGLVSRTPHSITSRRALLQEIERVRQRGFAVDAEENELGVCCLGAPVFDYSSRPIAAISISGPAERITPARQPELGRVVRDAALRLSRRMGYPR
ncbi:MAG: IclR family transcriptional regulator [Rudaea sp.]